MYQQEDRMQFINGRFVRGGAEVLPEIGNREQIALLRQFERMAPILREQARSGKLRVVEDFKFGHLKLSAACVCGGRASMPIPGKWYVRIVDYAGQLLTCLDCGRSYKITKKRFCKQLKND